MGERRCLTHGGDDDAVLVAAGSAALGCILAASGKQAQSYHPGQHQTGHTDLSGFHLFHLVNFMAPSPLSFSPA